MAVMTSKAADRVEPLVHANRGVQRVLRHESGIVVEQGARAIKHLRRDGHDAEKQLACEIEDLATGVPLPDGAIPMQDFLQRFRIDVAASSPRRLAPTGVCGAPC